MGRHVVVAVVLELLLIVCILVSIEHSKGMVAGMLLGWQAGIRVVHYRSTCPCRQQQSPIPPPGGRTMLLNLARTAHTVLTNGRHSCGTLQRQANKQHNVGQQNKTLPRCKGLLGRMPFLHQ